MIAVTIAGSQKTSEPQNWFRIEAVHSSYQPYKYDTEDGQWTDACEKIREKLYPPNSVSNDVSVIEIATNAVVATVKAGDGPWASR
jgi:YVTN family beta-propeller protein